MCIRDSSSLVSGVSFVFVPASSLSILYVRTILLECLVCVCVCVCDLGLAATTTWDPREISLLDSTCCVLLQYMLSQCYRNLFNPVTSWPSAWPGNQENVISVGAGSLKILLLSSGNRRITSSRPKGNTSTSSTLPRSLSILLRPRGLYCQSSLGNRPSGILFRRARHFSLFFPQYSFGY